MNMLQSDRWGEGEGDLFGSLTHRRILPSSRMYMSADFELSMPVLQEPKDISNIVLTSLNNKRGDNGVGPTPQFKHGVVDIPPVLEDSDIQHTFLSFKM